jgi:acyl carrier protein phosphodiesterase
MFYDHFLAKNWSTYSTNPLDQYAQDAYAILNKYATIVPDQVGRLLPYMIQGNWLYNYSSIEGIHRALSGMAQRTPYNSKMEEASLDLKEHYDSFQNEFLRFFPELQSFCKEYLESKTNAT